MNEEISYNLLNICNESEKLDSYTLQMMSIHTLLFGTIPVRWSFYTFKLNLKGIKRKLLKVFQYLNCIGLLLVNSLNRFSLNVKRTHRINRRVHKNSFVLEK